MNMNINHEMIQKTSNGKFHPMLVKKLLMASIFAFVSVAGLQVVQAP